MLTLSVWSNLDALHSSPSGAPDDRDHNVRTTARSFDPNRTRGIYPDAGETLSPLPDNAASTRASPSSTCISSRRTTFALETRDARALHEKILGILLALDLINDVIGPSIQNRFNGTTELAVLCN